MTYSLVRLGFLQVKNRRPIHRHRKGHPHVCQIVKVLFRIGMHSDGTSTYLEVSLQAMDGLSRQARQCLIRGDKKTP